MLPSDKVATSSEQSVATSSEQKVRFMGFMRPYPSLGGCGLSLLSVSDELRLHHEVRGGIEHLHLVPDCSDSSVGQRYQANGPNKHNLAGAIHNSSRQDAFPAGGAGFAH